MTWKQTSVKPLLILAILFFGLFSLGQLQRIEVVPGIVLYAFDFVIGGFILYWLFLAKGWSQILAVGSRLRFTTNVKLWMFALGWLLLGWVFNPLGLEGAGTAFLYLGRLVTYAGFMYLLASAVDWHWTMQELEATTGRYPTLILFTLSGIAIAYLGFAQYLFLPDARFLTALGWDDHYFRMIGSMLDPAFMGILLVLTFIGVETIFIRKHQVTQTIFSLALVLAVSLTFSRSSYLALVAGGAILWWVQWWRRDQRWRAPLLLVVFAVCVFLIPKPGGEGVNLFRYSTVVARHESAIAVVTTQTPTQWLIGRGLFVPKQPILASQVVPDHARQPDMFLLTLTTGCGLLGWGVILALVYYYRSHWQRWPSWLWASLIAVLTASLFSNTLFQPFVWLWLTGIIWSVELQFKRDR